MSKIDTGNPYFKSESLLMSLAAKLGFARLRWSLRRLHVPVLDNALVLEVGAGGNPYPRANVLLDSMEATIERNEQILVKDRPLVLGCCEELPFKDKSFDFIIASHVLEHTSDPQKFLNELMRVGKAGYIETPEGWFEKMVPFTYHRLEISANKEKLIIRKKSRWNPDEISTLWELKLSNSKRLRRFLRINPDLNTLRFYWKNNIDYEVINPEIISDWPYPKAAFINLHDQLISNFSLIQLIRGHYLSIRRKLFSQNRRNRKINVYKLIRCPTCYSENTQTSGTLSEILCLDCNTAYEITNGIPRLFSNKINVSN